MNGAKVTAIIVNFNGGQDLVSCIDALTEDEPTAEVLVVDNGSTDGSLDAARERLPEVRIVTPPENLGFAGGANFGASLAQGEVLLFLNPDLFVQKGCLSGLVEGLAEGAGAAGPALFVEASGREEFGGVIDWFGYPASLVEPGRPIYVPGCALATPSRLFHELGGFDERYFMFAEDIDYCWRVLLTGKDVVVAPNSRALHRGGAATAGGYGLRGQRKTPSVFRFSMRERNSLAMLIKCMPTTWLALVIPLYVLQSLLTAVAALPLKRAVSIEILKGIFWNLHEFSRTLERRRRVPRHSSSKTLIKGRIRAGSNKVRTVLRHGLPRFSSE